MRVSTTQIFRQAVNNLLDQQARLTHTQDQLSTGKRVLAPSDDPAGAARSLDLSKGIARAEQFSENADRAQSRLGLEESVLSQSTSLLHRVRELTVQGNNGTMTQQDRSAIAAEVRELRSQLIEYANTRDANAEYLFAGSKTGVEPFSLGANGQVSYQGDQTQRELQIGSERRVASTDDGRSVFMDIDDGNGTFDTAASTSNTGTGVIDGGSVNDPSSYDGNDYRIDIDKNSSGELVYMVYDVTNSTYIDPAGGNPDNATKFTSGEAIQFKGIEVTIDGTPDDTDSFTVKPSQSQSVFETLQNIIDGLERSGSTDADQALVHNELGSALADIDRALENLGDVRAKVGGRLNSIEQQRGLNEAAKLDFQKAQSEIQDLDYAEAISRFERQRTALQAAQQSFAKLKNLSLFNYIS